MNKKQIKKIVNDVFEKETPDFLSVIKQKCENVEQFEPEEYKVNKVFNYKILIKRLALTAFGVMIFLIGLFIGGIEPSVEVMAAEASIYLDVNPSIEIQVDENNKVIKCVAGNDDAIKVLENIVLDGVDMNTALYAIVGSLYSKGYLNIERNSILVSVISYHNKDKVVLNEISEQINNVFKENEEMNCSIIAQKVSPNDELKDKANENKVSVGKMQLIEKIIENSKLYADDNLEELIKMSIHELGLIYKSINNKDDENEVMSGNASGYLDDDSVIDHVLESLNLTRDDVRFVDAITLYHYDENHDRKLVYLVTFMLQDSITFEKYIVDCVTGEMMPDDTVDDWKDKIFDKLPNFGLDDKEPSSNQNENHDKDNDSDKGPGNQRN